MYEQTGERKNQHLQKMNIQINETNRQKFKWANDWRNEQTNKPTNKWSNEVRNGQTNRQTNKYLNGERKI